MGKVYLTNSNYKRVLNTFTGYTEKYEFIITEIGNGFDESQLFSDNEKNQILLNKNFILKFDEFYKNNELVLNKQIFRTNIENPYKLYNSIPAYHKSSECENLKKDYENFILDKKIPLELLDSYKEWLKRNKSLYSKSRQTFDLIHKKNWGDKISLPEYIEHKNSGSKEIVLDNIQQLRREIRKLCMENVEKKDKEEFIECVKLSNLAQKDNKDIKKFIIKKYKKTLIKIHRLKMEIINCLITFYINEKNDGCNIDILKKVGFKECSCCHK
ncbi:hypothetical protein H5J22_00350 [Cetobacterium sp. 8H]|uniref:hypothetical protein n=1 Tax=Cetobacterium sp. 8H TaxID=2759681 RepID=UPI00163BBD5D|nr:hypothetical protein [Cetobacterium sp. 8H]MBC2849909.1 hypothetical protein [Cetobacterium sp. 8H]